MKCIIDTVNTDVTNKIILKNTTTASNFKKNFNLSILNQQKKTELKFKKYINLD